MLMVRRGEVMWVGQEREGKERERRWKDVQEKRERWAWRVYSEGRGMSHEGDEEGKKKIN